MPLKRPGQPARPTPRGPWWLLWVILLGPALAWAGMAGEDDRPDIQQGIEAWFIAREAVDQMHVPPKERTRVDEESPEFRSVSVILRFRGEIIGMGDASDLGTETLYTALLEAVRNARLSRKVRELPIEMIPSVGRGTTIELELAGEPTPMLGRTIEDVARELRPGIDGLALRRGTEWSYVFPGRMQAFGQAERPSRSLIRLMRDAGLPPRSPEELRRVEDIGIYSFQTLTLTQEAPGAPPHESIRGAKRVFVQSAEDVRETALQVASGCANNIRARLASNPDKLVGDVPGGDRLIALGLFGDYDTVRNEFDPLIAPAPDQALASWALVRYALHAPQLSNPQREALGRFVILTLERLEIVDSVEAPPLEAPVSAALITLATIELEQLNRAIGTRLPLPPIGEQARRMLVEQVEDEEERNRMTATTAALRNLAARSLERTKPGSFDEQALIAMDQATWAQHDSSNLAGSLPWLLMGESTAPGRDAERWRLASATIDALVASQIGHQDSLVAIRPPAEDLVGGFVTGAAGRTSADSTSLRPALALAIALRNPPEPLDPQQRRSWSEADRRSIRFVDQIQVNPCQLHRAPVPERALGGIKQSPWSNQTRLADTSLGLLLATELLMETEMQLETNLSNGPEAGPERPKKDAGGNPGGEVGE